MVQPEGVGQNNWFDQDGSLYARFRPRYPDELARFLCSVAPDTRLALDVGCGTGQLTVQLARHFDHVVGVDTSAEQIANAAAHPRIAYQCAPAEQLPQPERSASLVAAAQAAHWFTLPEFYCDVRRVLKPGGVLALITYGTPRLEDKVEGRFSRFYRREIGPYWPAQRKLVDEGYAAIDFPFREFAAPPLSIQLEWSLAELLGYISTWSAVRQAAKLGRSEILVHFAGDLANAWGDPDTRRSIVWPIHMRIGTR